MSKTYSKTRLLVEGALMIALATVLSGIKLFALPQGGSVTLEMIPLVMMGLRHGPRWGSFTCFVHGFLQMLLGFSNVLYCKTLAAQVGCVLLDYLLAFTCLGLVGWFAGFFGGDTPVAAAAGICCVCALRTMCHFISGIWLWGEWAPQGTPVWLYSLGYNGGFMLADTVITALCVALLVKNTPGLFRARE